MNQLSFRIARRYLFSRKSTNAINVITAVTASGIALGTAAFIIILSVFNGFEDLIGGMYNVFNPDIKVSPAKGKVFVPDTLQLKQVQQIPSVEAMSYTLEEIALFVQDDAHTIGTLKGVDQQYAAVSFIDTMLYMGKFITQNKGLDYAVVGIGIADQLMLAFDTELNASVEPFKVYMPKRVQQSSSFLGSSQPFKAMPLYPAGTFELLQDFSNHVITNIDFTRNLLSYNEGEVSAIEIRLEKGASLPNAKAQIAKLMGPDFEVKDRFEQDASFYRVTNMEKWISYLIISFTLVLIAFNMIGALSMIVVDKRQDIAVLKAMGASDRLVHRIFLAEGLLISGLGALAGFIIGGGLCLAQQLFGLVRLQGSGSFIVDAYPVSMRWGDFLLVFITILVIGLFASWIPAMRAARMKSLIRAD
jgi:lipoprotein-releasing system permease protein